MMFNTIASTGTHFPSTYTSDQKIGYLRSESGPETISLTASYFDIHFPFTFGKPRSSESDSSAFERFRFLVGATFAFGVG